MLTLSYSTLRCDRRHAAPWRAHAFRVHPAADLPSPRGWTGRSALRSPGERRGLSGGGRPLPSLLLRSEAPSGRPRRRARHSRRCHRAPRPAGSRGRAGDRANSVRHSPHPESAPRAGLRRPRRGHPLRLSISDRPGNPRGHPDRRLPRDPRGGSAVLPQPGDPRLERLPSPSHPLHRSRDLPRCQPDLLDRPGGMRCRGGPPGLQGAGRGCAGSSRRAPVPGGGDGSDPGARSRRPGGLESDRLRPPRAVGALPEPAPGSPAGSGRRRDPLPEGHRLPPPAPGGDGLHELARRPPGHVERVPVDRPDEAPGRRVPGPPEVGEQPVEPSEAVGHGPAVCSCHEIRFPRRAATSRTRRWPRRGGRARCRAPARLWSGCPAARCRRAWRAGCDPPGR